ncbi:hypothetical protein SAMN02745171_01645, partial [Porphyromonas circumdentaria]
QYPQPYQSKKRPSQNVNAKVILYFYSAIPPTSFVAKKPQSNNRFSKRPAGLPYFASAKLLLFIPYIQINTTIKTVKKKLYPKKQRLTSQNYFDKQPFCNKKTKKNMIISWKKVAKYIEKE